MMRSVVLVEECEVSAPRSREYEGTDVDATRFGRRELTPPVVLSEECSLGWLTLMKAPGSYLGQLAG
jgi:hypothetical protein